MLLVLTILAGSAIRNSNLNLRIVGNMDAADHSESVTVRAIERTLSDIANFESPSKQQLQIDGEIVTVAPPECLIARPATGYSARWSLTPEDTTWEVKASHEASTGGASTAMTQGVDIRMTKGSCP
jgi:Tfp pilus assembly protein PilX